MSNETRGQWRKKKDSDQIWWLEGTGRIGEWIFSFDKVHKFNMFRDYPYKLTEEQKAIFDKENPYWVDFFKDRVKEKQNGGASYWKKRTFDRTEHGLATAAFAEFTESHIVNKESLAVLKKFLLTTSTVYLKMIKDAVSKEG